MMDAGTLEPLLRKQEDEEREEQEEQEDHRQKQLIPYRPFDILSFMWSLISNFQGAMQACLMVFLPWCCPEQHPALTLHQAQKLERLHASIQQPFVSEDPSHDGLLRQLYSLSFPGESCPETMTCERWKDMGWQGSDPRTDIRGSGLVGVQLLVYMAQNHPPVFKDLMHKRQGTRAEWEYPFAAGGTNLTFALAEVLGMAPRGLRTASSLSPVELEGLARAAPCKGFLALMSQENEAFGELYVASFRYFDRTWLQRKASYMQFNEVMTVVKQDLKRALATNPSSVSELHSALQLQPFASL